jgi:16S rRNA processing protein RimM
VTTAQADFVTIGKIERHFGVRGEFKVRSLSDVPGRLDHLKQVQVLEPTGQTVERTVTHVRRAGSTYIMGLAGVTTPEEAGVAGIDLVPRVQRHYLRMSILNVICWDDGRERAGR